MSCHAFPRLSMLSALVMLGLSGCATKDFVQKEVDVVHLRINTLERQLGEAGHRIDANVGRIQAGEERLSRAERTAGGLHKRLDETQADLDGANRNVAGILVGLNAANQRIDANSTEIARNRARVETLSQQLGVTSQRLDGALASLAQADVRLGTLEMAGRPEAAGAQAVAAPATSIQADRSEAVPVVVQQAGPQANLQDRLTRVDTLIDEVRRRVTANTASLRNSDSRISELERGLRDAGRRNTETEAAVKQAQGEIGVAQTRLADADKRIDANSLALREMGLKIEATGSGLKEADARLREGEKQLGEVSERLNSNTRADAGISATAQEALARATTAGKLAEGKLLAETVLSEEVMFAPAKAVLNDAAKQALGAFADKLKAGNQGVFIEVQGHTDDSGRARANMGLSRQRAEAVRDFLHQSAGIPLHRLAVAAYGETRPVADNKTPQGRDKNRRVVLVVLK